MENKPIPSIDRNNPDDIKWLEKEAQEKKIEHDHGIEIAAGWILAMLEKKEKYSERIPLKMDKSFDIPGDVTEPPNDVSQLVRAARQMEYSLKGLYDLTNEIVAKHPELEFSFKLDNEGKWVEYSVQKRNA
jgi:hypothetical protein